MKKLSGFVDPNRGGTKRIFYFQDQTVIAGGCLPNDVRAHACWYYYLLCDKIKDVVGDELSDQVITFEAGSTAPAYLDQRYSQTARVVADIYSLDSPDEFLKFRFYTMQEAKRLHMPEPHESYMKPKGYDIIH